MIRSGRVGRSRERLSPHGASFLNWQISSAGGGHLALPGKNPVGKIPCARTRKISAAARYGNQAPPNQRAPCCRVFTGAADQLAHLNPGKERSNPFIHSAYRCIQHSSMPPMTFLQPAIYIRQYRSQNNQDSNNNRDGVIRPKRGLRLHTNRSKQRLFQFITVVILAAISRSAVFSLKLIGSQNTWQPKHLEKAGQRVRSSIPCCRSIPAAGCGHRYSRICHILAGSHSTEKSCRYRRARSRPPGSCYTSRIQMSRRGYGAWHRSNSPIKTVNVGHRICASKAPFRGGRQCSAFSVQ